ncbi:MAG TPA: hypothetical protein VKU00_01420 [Chthonomonadaceae bacterium]|nr:hypothetical protein [Chthonomonadaceae bacterium]
MRNQTMGDRTLSLAAIRGQCIGGIALLALCLSALASAQTKPAAPPAGGNKATAPPANATKPMPAPGQTQGKPGTPPNTPMPPGTAAKPPDGTPAPFVKPNRPLGAITALAFSPDGKKLAVGTYGQVVLFDTTTWQQLGQFKQVVDSVRALAFHPNGQILAVGSGSPGLSGFTALWDTSGSQASHVYPQQYDTIEALDFRNDGNGLLLGADDNKARYFTSLTSNEGTLLDAHNGRVQAVAFSPKVDFIYITGAMDKIVKVWVEKTNQNVINFDQSENGITGLAFLNNGVQFVGSSLDGRLYWWGVAYDERKKTYNGYHFRTIGAHQGGVYALSMAANRTRMITGGADNVVSIWNPDNGGKMRDFKDSTQPIYAVALSPDGKTAVGGGREGLIFVWDVDGNKLLNTLVPPPLSTPTNSGSGKKMK